MNVVIQNQINRKAMCLEVLTCEHCNLKCRYCARYSCIAKPRFYELEQFKQDILDLKKTNIKIASLTFSGGEPLMNPNLIKMIEFARSQLHDTSLVILTNGIILSSKPLEYFKTLSYLKVGIIYTQYGKTDTKYHVLVNKCRIAKVQIVNIGNISDCPTVRTTFNQNKISKKCFSDAHSNKQHCTQDCTALYNGKIYQCGKTAFNHVLNEYFKTDFEVTNKDYLEIKDLKSFEQFKDFISNETPFCRYCGAPCKSNLEWERVNKEVPLSDYVV